MILFKVLYFLLLIISVSSLYQSYGVRGRLLCGENSASSIKVKLIEMDRYSHENDLLDEGITDEFGNFSLSGGTAELTRIEPMLETIHDCNDGNRIGQRKSKFLLPHFYITNGLKSMKTFDIGIINLEAVFLPDERDYSEHNAQKSLI
ncbi:unnamed protein product [Caenorhabditis brenneri]